MPTERFLQPKQCAQCEITFQPCWVGRKYCSKVCGDLAKRTLPPESNCKNCGTIIKTKRGRVRTFCSKKCEFRAPRERYLTEKPCERCQTMFQPHADVQRFCSKVCGYASKRKPRRPQCLHCDGPLRPESVPKTVYCSVKCSALDRKVNARFKRSIGSLTKTSSGYTNIKLGKGHPQADAAGNALYHRFLMENHLGRSLTAYEYIHHKNGIRTDNRLENLELWASWSHGSKSDPRGQRVQDLLDFMVNEYESDVLRMLRNKGYEVHTRKAG